MKVYELTLLWSLLFIFLSNATIAQDLLIFKDKKKPVEIAKYISIYEDSTNGLSINTILSSETQSQFIKIDKSVLSLGFSQSSFWLKCSFVHNGTEDLVLQIKNVLLDSIQVYLIDNDSIVWYKQAGLLMPYSDRDINTNYYIFNLPITSKSIYDLYIRVNSHLPVEVFAEIGLKDTILENNTHNKLLHGIYFGFIILMIFYNLFIYNTVRDIGYLIYVFNCLCIGVSMAINQGFLFQYIFPEHYYFNTIINSINITCLSVSVSIVFAVQFLRVRRYFTLSYYIGCSFIAIFMLLIIANLLGYTKFTFITSQFAFGIIAILGLYVPYYIYRQGFRPARFYLLAWIGVIIGGLIDIFKANQFLPANIFTNNAYQVGTALEMLLLSFALADKINIYKEDRIQAKEENIALMQKNLELAESNVYLIKEQNVILEEKVKERTLELRIANKEILEQNEELHTQERELMTTNQELVAQTALIERQNQELKNTSYRLNTSIRYAQHIQNIILPNQEKISNFFQENFVIYLPKDFVSGDFYWFVELSWDRKWKKENQDLLRSINPNYLTNKAILAMIDCTGHGVPGAFMTMIVHTLLHEIVEIKRISNPAFILQNLHTGIKNLLKQHDGKNSDGMDISICYFEKDESKKHCQVTFAGAKGIAFYVQNNEIVQLGSERYSIGGSLKKERKFTNQTITLSENTMLYLASDGYIDQNDAGRVKFGSKNFKELLSKIHQYPVQLQYDALLEALKIHIGEEEQRDDISVVGIRL